MNELIAEPELGEEVWPKLSICGAVGTVLGLGLGCLLSLVMELRTEPCEARGCRDSQRRSNHFGHSDTDSAQEHSHQASHRGSGFDGGADRLRVACASVSGSGDLSWFANVALLRAGGIDARVIATTSPRRVTVSRPS